MKRAALIGLLLVLLTACGGGSDDDTDMSQMPVDCRARPEACK